MSDLENYSEDFEHLNFSKQHEAVQLLKLNETSKKFELQSSALQNILSENDVGDCNIAVISIAGAFRKGKSFMLSLFLRYLNAVYENNNEVDWFGDESEDLKGFDWRSGSKRQTTGIWIWSKIFTATRANGERIGVMLMDTQGISSKESTVNEDMIIFSFSTMLSSVQIFNLFNNIQEDDLQNLQLYTEYAKRSMQQISSTQSLQKLLFLIRDWSFPYEASYGFDGGRQILGEKLAIDDDQEAELRNVREYLSSSYDDIDCCLMPHIGGTANTSRDFRGQLQHLTEAFKETLKILVIEVLHPNNVVVKRNTGHNIPAHSLLSCIESHWNAILSAGFKTAQSISNTTAETNVRTAVMTAMSFYDQEMGKNTESGAEYKTPEEMLNMNSTFTKQALDIFDATAIFGDKQLRQSHRAKLTAEFENKFQLYLGQNEGKRVNDLSVQKELLLNEVQSQATSYNEQMRMLKSLTSQLEIERHSLESSEMQTAERTTAVPIVKRPKQTSSVEKSSEPEYGNRMSTIYLESRKSLEEGYMLKNKKLKLELDIKAKAEEQAIRNEYNDKLRACEADTRKLEFEQIKLENAIRMRDLEQQHNIENEYEANTVIRKSNNKVSVPENSSISLYYVVSWIFWPFLLAYKLWRYFIDVVRR